MFVGIGVGLGFSQLPGSSVPSDAVLWPSDSTGMLWPDLTYLRWPV